MTSGIGIISMFYARPFGPEHLDLLPRIKAAGLQFIELLVPEPGEIDIGEVRRALNLAGLGVVLAARVNAARDLASEDRASHDAAIAYLRSCVDIAAVLGAKIVGGPLYGAPLVFAGRAPTPVDERTRAARVARVIAGLKEAAEYAAHLRVKLAIEPLNRFETDMVNTAGQGLALVEAVGSPAVGLMLDTFHMNMEEASIEGAIREAGSRLIHFQANENHRGFIGTGHLDWPAIGEALRTARYAGPITLEPFRRDDDRIGVPLAQWRPPRRDESEELKRSIAVLRAVLPVKPATP